VKERVGGTEIQRIGLTTGPVSAVTGRAIVVVATVPSRHSNTIVTVRTRLPLYTLWYTRRISTRWKEKTCFLFFLPSLLSFFLSLFLSSKVFCVYVLCIAKFVFSSLLLLTSNDNINVLLHIFSYLPYNTMRV